jgi:hypothetical protein
MRDMSAFFNVGPFFTTHARYIERTYPELSGLCFSRQSHCRRREPASWNLEQGSRVVSHESLCIEKSRTLVMDWQQSWFRRTHDRTAMAFSFVDDEP